MPQIIIKHACIADVFQEEDGKERGQNKLVKLNIDEEDFYQMLDSVNPKNIIKYLDMRNIPHREPLKINLQMCQVIKHPDITAKK